MSDDDNTGPSHDGCIPQLLGIIAIGWLLARIIETLT